MRCTTTCSVLSNLIVMGTIEGKYFSVSVDLLVGDSWWLGQTEWEAQTNPGITNFERNEKVIIVIEINPSSF